MHRFRMLAFTAVSLIASVSCASAAWQDHIGKTVAATVEGNYAIRDFVRPMSMEMTYTMLPEGLLINRGAFTLDGQTTPASEGYPGILFDPGVSEGIATYPAFGGAPESQSAYTMREENGAFVLTIDVNPAWEGFEETHLVKFAEGADCAATYLFKTEDATIDLKPGTCTLIDTP